MASPVQKSVKALNVEFKAPNPLSVSEFGIQREKIYWTRKTRPASNKVVFSVILRHSSLCHSVITRVFALQFSEMSLFGSRSF